MKYSNWYAVYTRPNREKQVTDLLLKKGIETYCPYNKIYVRYHGRNKEITEPLFRSNVFFRQEEEKLGPVLQTRGVINFLYWLGQPAVIKNEEIEAIKLFLIEYPNIELERTPVDTDSELQVITSPLLKRNGNVLEVLNSTVKVMLPSLGRVLVANSKKETADHIIYREEFRVRV
jgi:transcription antitermination factor NusG